MIFETNSEQETQEIAKQIAKRVMPSDIICLNGQLGVGKTAFSKGFAEGLGIEEPITSPTFTIVQEYEQGRIPFYHFDVYRISDESEMEEIGYEDYFFGNGVCLIEWAELIEDIIPKEACHISIEKDLEKGFDYRRIKIDNLRELQ